LWRSKFVSQFTHKTFGYQMGWKVVDFIGLYRIEVS
jgi:hypothetical protein